MRTLTKSTLLGATMLGMAGAASAQGFEIQGAEALSEDATVVENMQLVQNFSTLFAAVQAAGLSEVLQGTGPFTIFAPLDSAFAALDPGAVDDLLLPENREQLIEVLQTHVVNGYFTSDDLATGFVTDDDMGGTDEPRFQIDGEDIRMQTLSAWDLLISTAGGSYFVSTDPGVEENAEIVLPDIVSSNGVIHVIDGVLMPN